MTNLVTPKTNVEILKLTTFLSNYFCLNNLTDLASICKDEELKLCIDDYGDYFDGMLVWDNKQFFIHLNTFKGNGIESKKGRFTLAHELGHYFINSHREGIKRGLIPPHPSFSCLVQSSYMELEADYFAASLLMPKDKIRKFTGGRKFSFDVIKQLSDEFGVSLTAAAIRFAEVGTHDVMVVFCKGNTIKWFTKSPDFPNLAYRFKVSGPPPPTSVIGESFLKSEAKYTSIEKVDLEDWFYYRPGAPELQLYEQCFYSDIYNYTISLLLYE